MPSHLRGLYITTAGDYKKQWTNDQLKQWIRTGGGHHLLKVTEQTTHLVVTQKLWQNQKGLVREALDATENSGQQIHILSWDWLEDSLTKSTKKKEAPYMWQKLDKEAMTMAKKKAREADRERKIVEGPQNVQGLMGEVFHKETEKYLTAAEKQRLEKKALEERRVQQQAEEEERRQKKQRERMSREEHEAVFKSGAKKARNDLLSDNHHIYQDKTGFKLDITLTKVDTKNNRNERVVLTIYESNAEPCTYAMSSQSAATGKRPENHIISAIGTPLETAFRAFRKIFEEKTGVRWDDRISHAIERAKAESARRERRQLMGSETGSVGLGRGRVAEADGLRKGLGRRKTDEELSAEKEEAEKEFRNALFQYQPPIYGPRGVMPEKLKEKEIGPSPSAHAVGVPLSKEKTNEIEYWMSGANDAVLPKPYVAVQEVSSIWSPASSLSRPLDPGVWNTGQFIHVPLSNAPLDMPGLYDLDSSFGLDNGLPSEAATEFDFEQLGRGSSVAPSQFAQGSSMMPAPRSRAASVAPSQLPTTIDQTQLGATQAAIDAGADMMAFIGRPKPQVNGVTPAALETSSSAQRKRKERDTGEGRDDRAKIPRAVAAEYDVEEENGWDAAEVTGGTDNAIAIE